MLGRVCLRERGPAGPSLGRSRRELVGERREEDRGSSMLVVYAREVLSDHQAVVGGLVVGGEEVG